MAANVALDTWRSAGGKIQDALSGVTRSLADVALASGRVNFAAQHEQVKQFEGAISRMSVASGRSFEQLQSSIISTGVAIGKQPEAVATWERELSRLTYTFDGAGESIRAMAGFAALTGRQVEDYRGMATHLTMAGVAGKDMSQVLGVMSVQAKELGTRGGVAALADQFDAAGDSIDRMVERGNKGITTLTATIGVLTQGLRGASAQMVAQQGMAMFQQDPRGWERFLGGHILNEQGQIDPVKMPELFQKLYNRVTSRFGHGETRRNVMLNNLPPELAMAVIRAGESGDFSKIGEIAAKAGDTSAQDALGAWKGTPGGKRETAQAELFASAEKLMGAGTALGTAADALQKVAATFPVASTFGTSVAGGMIQSVLNASMGGKGGGGGGVAGAAGEAAGTLAQLGIQGNAASKALGAVRAAGMVAAAAVAGWDFGTWLDKKYNISDRLSGTGKFSDLKAKEDAADEERNAVLRRKTAGTRAHIAATHADPENAEAIEARLKAVLPETASAMDYERLAKEFAKAIHESPLVIVDGSNQPVNLVNKNAKAPGNQRHG